jgi:hypothetical protein
MAYPVDIPVRRGRFDSTGDSKVTSLNISNNKLGPAGAKIIADAIKVGYVHAGCVQVLRRVSCIWGYASTVFFPAMSLRGKLLSVYEYEYLSTSTSAFPSMKNFALFEGTGREEINKRKRSVVCCQCFDMRLWGFVYIG